MFSKQVDRYFQIFGEDVTDKVAKDMQATKSKLLLESLILFSERGYDGISVRDIAERVGIQTSSLYNHFKNKQELLDVAIEMSSNLYGVYLNAIGERYLTVNSFVEILNVVVQNPMEVLNETSCYALSLIHCEKYRNRNSARVYANVFVDHSVNFYRNIFQDLISKGLCGPFDTKTAALIVNNAFHTAVNLSMQEYLGFLHGIDFSDMIYGIKDFILKQVFPKAKITDPNLKDLPRLPPFPKEMMNCQRLSVANGGNGAMEANGTHGGNGAMVASGAHGGNGAMVASGGNGADAANGPNGGNAANGGHGSQTLEGVMSGLSPEARQFFSGHLDGYLNLLQADCGDLTTFKLGDECQAVIRFLKESYLEPVATQATYLEHAIQIKKAMEAHSENWTKLKENIHDRIQNAEIKIQDIFTVFLTIEREYKRVYKRQCERGRTDNRPAEVSARLVESLLSSMQTAFGLLEKGDDGANGANGATESRKDGPEGVALVENHGQERLEKTSQPSGEVFSEDRSLMADQTWPLEKVDPSIDALLEDMITKDATAPEKGTKMIENLAQEKGGNGSERRETDSGFFRPRKSYGTLKRTDHKNLDVFVKVNGKIVKRPEPKLDLTNPLSTLPADELREPEITTALSASKAELDDMPLKSKIWRQAESLFKNKTRS
ncbi:MAG: TetR/AcrR family transcriptional regulator [Deltaproteobacteria bacterium]|jgi:AcrR family transcriptional regulator|nr:TetR/AcrR family transcriptional regulator [Deltaproteobacteria bacterium]